MKIPQRISGFWKENALSNVEAVGTVLELPSRMSESDGRQPTNCRLLSWVFQRGDQLLTCEIDHRPHDETFVLSFVPHWDVRATAVEKFEKSTSAFRRHATIATQLRSSGWTVAEYTRH
jgi:hypothetical protein